MSVSDVLSRASVSLSPFASSAAAGPAVPSGAAPPGRTHFTTIVLLFTELIHDPRANSLRCRCSISVV